MAEGLSIWTVYEKPTDFPSKYVARRGVATGKGTMTDDVLVADDLDGLRSLLPAGLYRMDRHPEDDPKIVETWM